MACSRNIILKSSSYTVQLGKSLVLLTLGFICLSYGFPQESKYGLSKSLCRTKWNQCMDGDERATSAECEVSIRRRYDCSPPSPDPVRDRGDTRPSRDDPEPVYRNRKADDDYKPKSRYDDSEPEVRRKVYPDDEPRVRSRVDDRSDSDVDRDRGSRSRSRGDEQLDDIPSRKYDRVRDNDDNRGRPRGDPRSIELDQNTRTVADNYRSKYQKNEGGNGRDGGGDLDEVRKRDKIKKEKERIFVKEDLVELDEGDGDKVKQTRIKFQKEKPIAEEKVKEMVVANKEKAKQTDKEFKETEPKKDKGKAVSSSVMKMLELQKTLL